MPSFSLPENRPLLSLGGAAGAGVFFILLYAMQFGWLTFLSVAGFGALVAGASSLLGAVLGFLFAVPRSLQADRPAPPTDVTASRIEPTYYLQNTNLEQISDWFTKILVGVGLTQIGGLPASLHDLADGLAPGLGASPSSGAFGVAIAVAFVLDGFLIGYEWTRLYFIRLLKKADQPQDVADRVQRLTTQYEADAHALQVIDLQLSAGSASDVPDAASLDEAVAQASPMTQQQIFGRAFEERTSNWRFNKERMALTIPIFQALVAAHPEVHMYHAQLAYALKDKQQPDYVAANAQLSEAIGRRGSGQASGWEEYEFNRAMCTIMLDPAYLAKQASADDVRKPILADMSVAAGQEKWLNLMKTTEPFQSWLDLNKIRAAQWNPSG